MKKTHLRNITNPQFDILFSAILSKKLNFKNFAKKNLIGDSLLMLPPLFGDNSLCCCSWFGNFDQLKGKHVV